MLAQAFRGKIRFVAVVDANQTGAAELAKKAELSFPLVADPDRKLILALKGREGLDLRLIGTDGQPRKGWDGLSRGNLKALISEIRLETGKTVNCSEMPFTVLTKLGCPFHG